jgi:hypothetical protein
VEHSLACRALVQRRHRGAGSSAAPTAHEPGTAPTCLRIAHICAMPVIVNRHEAVTDNCTGTQV